VRVILLPVKTPSNAKQRLAAVLSSEERLALTWAMLKDVGRALAGAKLVDRIVVVTSDPAVIQHALEQRWDVLQEANQISESDSVDWASLYLMDQGAAVVLRLPGDIPLLQAEDVDSLLSVELPPRAALLVPSRDGSGTNALLRKPPDAFPSRFGPNSLCLHQQEADYAGVAVEVIQNPRIGLDIDDMTDLAAFWAQGRQTFAASIIRDMHLAEKFFKTRERNHVAP
jgi:2-phospho-L-lactate/phosphoenolpyruvate guanylyltransferase